MIFSTVIAIDGPSGVGKSTIAKEISQRLGYTYIDTGAMFRALGFYLNENNILENEIEKIQHTLENINFEYGVNDDILVQVNSVDLTTKIREHFVSDLASRYSKIPAIRSFLANFQKKLAQARHCVMEGRDIGTVIFPDAFLKIFLTASDEVRAKRRFLQLKEKGEQVDLSTLIQDIQERDKRDSSREVAPLKKAKDAHEIDTDNLSIEEVINSIIALEATNKRKLTK